MVNHSIRRGSLGSTTRILDNVAHHQSRNTTRSFASKTAPTNWMKQQHVVDHNMRSSQSSLPWKPKIFHWVPVIKTNHAFNSISYRILWDLQRPCCDGNKRAHALLNGTLWRLIFTTFLRGLRPSLCLTISISNWLPGRFEFHPTSNNLWFWRAQGDLRGHSEFRSCIWFLFIWV
jgi:hypothetical protein